jgi:hypothetical protein
MSMEVFVDIHVKIVLYDVFHCLDELINEKEMLPNQLQIRIDTHQQNQ